MLQSKQINFNRLSASKIYYISPSGNDHDEEGTETNPWKTISHAFDYVNHKVEQAGYAITFQLADGTYNERLNPSPDTKRINIRGNANNINAVKITSDVKTSYVVSISYNVHLAFYDLTFQSNNNEYGIIVTDSSHLFIENCLIGNFTKTCVYSVDGGTLIDVRGITVAANTTGSYLFLCAYQSQMRFYNTIACQSNVSPTYFFYALRFGLITHTATITGNPGGRAFSNMLSIIEGKSKFAPNLIQQTSNGGIII